MPVTSWAIVSVGPRWTEQFWCLASPGHLQEPSEPPHRARNYGVTFPGYTGSMRKSNWWVITAPSLNPLHVWLWESFQKLSQKILVGCSNVPATGGVWMRHLCIAFLPPCFKLQFHFLVPGRSSGGTFLFYKLFIQAQLLEKCKVKRISYENKNCLFHLPLFNWLHYSDHNWMSKSTVVWGQLIFRLLEV